MIEGEEESALSIQDIHIPMSPSQQLAHKVLQSFCKMINHF